MLCATLRDGTKICARCGEIRSMTIDHFIPKSCRMPVNSNMNYVGLCRECNLRKANSVVLPTWYVYLNETQQEKLKDIMRYSRSWVKRRTFDPEFLKYLYSL